MKIFEAIKKFCQNEEKFTFFVTIMTGIITVPLGVLLKIYIVNVFPSTEKMGDAITVGTVSVIFCISMLAGIHLVEYFKKHIFK